MPKIKDLTGQKFGCLEVIGLDESRNKRGNHYYWLCKCECGNIRSLRAYSLKTSDYSTCHCNSKNYHLVTHGKTHTRIYRIWGAMKARCNRKTSDHYAYYGGIGISVCDEWEKDFKSFYEWSMANGYDEHLTIDRKDVSKGYSPDNCRWITLEDQARNKRNTVRITINGETKTVHEWSKISSVPPYLLAQRVRTFPKPIGGNYSEEILKKSFVKKKIAQYTLDGILIKIWDSNKAICDSGLGTQSGVSHCCIGYCKQHNGYVWKYSE